MICQEVSNTRVHLDSDSYDDGNCTAGADSCIGETGEKPYLAAGAFLRGGDRPKSDSPRGRPFGLPFANGFRVHDESFELECVCPWLCSCVCALYSAYGDRTAPCTCLFPLMSDRWCRWPWSLIGDALLAEPFEYVEYCDCERSWLWACEVGATGSAYVDAISYSRTALSSPWWCLESA